VGSATDSLAIRVMGLQPYGSRSAAKLLVRCGAKAASIEWKRSHS
jgi:hypothetical protein